MLKRVKPSLFRKAEIKRSRGVSHTVEVSVGLEYSVILELCGSVVLAEGSVVPVGLDGGRCGGVLGWCKVVMLSRMVENGES